MVVTPTAEPAPQQQMIMGFPAATEQEAKTAQAAYDAAPKCQPDPAWKDQKFTIGVYSAGQRGAIWAHLLLARQVRGDDRRLL